ncbi:MAG: DUF1570 domain-containing protein [Planctomycetaceae bacterium]|nr:DUF1570 domain-containing protein [Planctomycetaceae bacterium]
MSRLLVAIAVLLLSLSSGRVEADVFTYFDIDGSSQTVTARLAATGDGFLVLELDDGRWQLVPELAVRQRVPGDDPTPVTCEVMGERLTKIFTPELFRVRIKDPFVVGLVLTAPLDDESVPKLDRFFDKAVALLESVHGSYAKFIDRMGLPLEDPKFPLVMLIFETDEDFDEYAKLTTGGRGLSAGAMAGFYSGLSNWLSIRLDECDSFEVPLHEAIHQQVHNRGLLQRLAPVPVWFGEGIATGFESEGNRVKVDPTRMSRNYGGNARRQFTVTFADVIEKDDAFRGDVLAGDAYTLAWCLHWLLVTTKPDEYTTFVKHLGTLEPLAPKSNDERLSEFKSMFDIEPGELEKIVGEQLAIESRKTRTPLTPKSRPVGRLVTQDQMGVLELSLVGSGNATQGMGRLKNLSPFRTLTFHVQVADQQYGIAWMAERVAPGRRVSLEKRIMPSSQTDGYAVSIRSVVPDTSDEQQMREGFQPFFSPASINSSNRPNRPGRP